MNFLFPCLFRADRQISFELHLLHQCWSCWICVRLYLSSIIKNSSFSSLYLLVFCIYNPTYWYSLYSHLYKNLNHVVLYNHANIDHDSIFAMNYIQFHIAHIYTHMIHAELFSLFRLLLLFTPAMFFTLFRM